MIFGRHPSIVGYKEAFFEDQSSCLCLVMDFLDDGDLYQKIVKFTKEKRFIDEETIWRIFLDIVQALKALHSKNILHRDLKSANVFLQKNGGAKLGDLNVSKVAKKGLLYTQTGTPYYASPEVWRDQPYGSKSDIWSLGCVLYEMVTLRPPFRANDMNGLYKRVLKGVYPSIDKQFSSDMKTVIARMLQVNAKDRPSCQQILEMELIKNKAKQLGVYIDTSQPERGNHSRGNSRFNPDELTGETLLKTIKVPTNLANLSSRLPKSNYEKTRGSEHSVLLNQRNLESLNKSTQNRKSHSVYQDSDVQQNQSNARQDLPKPHNEYDSRQRALIQKNPRGLPPRSIVQAQSLKELEKNGVRSAGVNSKIGQHKTNIIRASQNLPTSKKNYEESPTMKSNNDKISTDAGSPRNARRSGKQSTTGKSDNLERAIQQ